MGAFRKSIPTVAACAVITAAACAARGAEKHKNLVANGTFADAENDGRPDRWTTAGAREIRQRLEAVTDATGRRAGKLTCTRFAGGSAAGHAMVCQVGAVAVRKGRWYRLSWRARGEGMKRNVVQVALSNTANWTNAGLNHSFPVGRTWREYDHTFRATADLPAKNSRLQFWFRSTGTFLLADVRLVPSGEIGYRCHPVLDTGNAKNAVPNSSFECGGAGWGGYNPSMKTWAGNVYRLQGAIDKTTAFHGDRSLRMRIDREDAPVFRWDWFDLVEEPVPASVAGHRGWVSLEKGRPYTVSCAMKADRDGVPAVILAREGERNRLKQVTANRRWRRVAMSFDARGGFAWAGAGVDPAEKTADGATLWIDALQFEAGDRATTYGPRSGVESGIETGRTGNIFDDPDAGLTVRITAFNDTGDNATVRGTLAAGDFFDRTVFTREISFPVETGNRASITVAGIAKGRRGFFRLRWTPATGTAVTPSLRCAVFEPHTGKDSVIGMNHAYGWPFLLRLSRHAGITWFRDWSVKWHAVEPRRGAFDFSGTDRQVDRVLSAGLNVDLLFPFPAAGWASTADPAAIRKAESRSWIRQRLVYACAPAHEKDFRRYVARSVAHYRGRVRHYQVFNEPVYTHYSLPGRLGYTVDDYIRWLNVASEEIRSAQEDAVVIGGMGSWASSRWTRAFVEKGGLRHVDILDLHNYPVTADPESYEEDIAGLRKAMVRRGAVRPLWLTEYGCYGDDDPWRTPQRAGDAAMNRSLWPGEREAAEALVQSAAVFCSHGLKKIFLHAGTCGPLNGADTGSVFFEYGGAPRKMLPAAAVLCRLLTPGFTPHPPPSPAGTIRRYVFAVKNGTLAIAWSRQTRPPAVNIPAGMTVRDIMGNEVSGETVTVTVTPLYFFSKTMSPGDMAAALKPR